MPETTKQPRHPWIMKECFVCHEGYGCNGKSIDDESRAKLEAMFTNLGHFLYIPSFTEPCECDLGSAYDNWKNLIECHEQFAPYLKELHYMTAAADEFSFYIDENGRLAWFWECDDDFTGGSSGLMPFCYSEEEAGNTWAYSELPTLLREIFWYNKPDDFEGDFVMPENLKCDEDVLKYITQFIHQNQ